MTWIVPNLWWVPVLPLLAAGIIALSKASCRTLASSLAVGSMVLGFFLSCAALVYTLAHPGERFVQSIPWFALGEGSLRLSWMLDPLSAAMLVMITFVGGLIFIYSVGYMAHDPNFTRFFCFLSLFAAAMLGLVIANNLLLLFMCWELVGLASYLLIGFWYHKPSAAAAAKKAFITTRIGDIGFLLGLLWLYAEAGTLLCYDGGAGCLEQGALNKLVGRITLGGMAASTAISLLLFCGAIGKSGQLPLHVWLPDAMEGPTPVSALIHAATMVAAGVFLVARVYPLMAAVPASAPTKAAVEASAPAAAPARIHVARPDPDPLPKTAEELKEVAELTRANPAAAAVSTPLRWVTWIGALTAVFAALIAVAQTDIKRILAYSTVSQLGFMFLGLGVGGVAVGMFHLLTHAFFKALLFLGSGSVIHGCREEQDIRRMGGLRKFMPLTFATYAIGMMSLAGVPLLFCGFWSKDEILHSAWSWAPGKVPFLLAITGAFLTAFYMTRQMVYVFFGPSRLAAAASGPVAAAAAAGHDESAHDAHSPSNTPHESPPVMTLPLAVLAACVVLLSVFATPVFPWFHSFLSGHAVQVEPRVEVGALLTMLLSTVIVGMGLGLGWRIYGRRPIESPDQPDPLEGLPAGWYDVLRRKFLVDELYELSLGRFNEWCARASRRLDDRVWSSVVSGASTLVVVLSWMNRLVDEYVVNLGFDRGCGGVRIMAWLISFWQNGQVQRYLRFLALGVAVGALCFLWGCNP